MAFYRSAPIITQNVSILANSAYFSKRNAFLAKNYLLPARFAGEAFGEEVPFSTTMASKPIAVNARIKLKTAHFALVAFEVVPFVTVQTLSAVLTAA